MNPVTEFKFNQESASRKVKKNYINVILLWISSTDTIGTHFSKISGGSHWVMTNRIWISLIR